MIALAERVGRLRAQERLNAINDALVPFMDRADRREYLEHLQADAREPRRFSTPAEVAAFARAAGIAVVREQHAG